MNESKKHCTLILLSGGQGKRMGGEVAKQYLKIDKKPILWYSLEAAQASEIIDSVVLVIRPEDENFVRDELLSKGNFTKVSHIAYAGCERYESVWSGLAGMLGVDWTALTTAERAVFLKNTCDSKLPTDIVFIHDGARPFLSDEIIARCYRGAVSKGACVAAVKSKDTVKIVGEDGKIISTPDRKNVWNMQTPQTFEAALVLEAYRRILMSGNSNITDDAQVVELSRLGEVYVVEGDYTNIKITTPEDLLNAEMILSRKNGKNRTRERMNGSCIYS